MTASKPTVLFVCVHNAGRSQMAAGYLAHLAGGTIEVRSAGSAPADAINPVAVRAMAEEGIDLTAEQPKILTDDAVRASDVVVTGKKRYDCFAATDLDHVLRSRGVQTLLLTGVNTNSCVLATTVAANTRDYAAVVVEECVDTMDRSLHDAALRVIGTAFGWVAGLDETVAAL